MRVRRGDEVGEVGEGTECWVGVLEVAGPVAMVGSIVDARVVDDGRDVFYRRGDPDRLNPHAGQVAFLDCFLNAFPAPATVQLQLHAAAAEGRACRIVRRITIDEPV